MIADKIYQYFDRNPQLHVLFIFDPSGMKREELDAVQWREGYRLLAPDGGWFTIKYNIDNDWKDDKVVMYFPQLSPLDANTDFPIMDLLKANMVYHEQDFAAFMQQHGIKHDFAAFISNHIAELQSDKLHSLLEPHYQDGSFNTDLANRAFLSLYFDKQPKAIADWQTIIIRLCLLADKDEETKRKAFFSRLEKNHDARRALEDKLMKMFGSKLELNTAERVVNVLQKIKYNAIVQSLPVSQADNYKHLRINDGIVLQSINNLVEQALADKKRSEQFLRVLRTVAADIREDEIVRVYGVDADYWTVTPHMAWAVLKTLTDDRLQAEPQEVLDRIAKLRMKCTDTSTIDEVLEFLFHTANYYDAVKAVKSTKLNTPDEYVSRYCSEFYLIDNYYRNAVNRFYAVDAAVVLMPSLERAKDALDQHYHKFTNRLNLEWIECVRATGGFKQVSLTRQQDFYKSYVEPMSVKVVVVISDALRYEVAAQLVERLTALRHPTKFEAALAMLPTETAYCKNALLPHTTLHFSEAQAMEVDGEVVGGSTQARQAHLQGYRPKSLCRTFETMVSNSRDENREVCKHDVVYIYHDTIDNGSHGHVLAKKITDNCEAAVDELAKLVKSLHGSWNATHVVVTSDHGFLFNDIKFEDKDKQKIAVENLESKSRYYITRDTEPQTNIASFPLHEVSGMDNTDLQVAVPLGTNRLYAPGGDYVFCHGGASLQEMIIPVIVSHRQDEERRDSVGAMVLEPNLQMTSSRVRFTVLQTDIVGGANKERTIGCAIYDGDNMVSPMETFTLNRSDASPEARKYPVELTLNKPTSAAVLKLRIYDIEDMLNPLVDKNITNNTLIQLDEF